jgi:hypothetical protein
VVRASWSEHSGIKQFAAFDQDARQAFIAFKGKLGMPALAIG